MVNFFINYYYGPAVVVNGGPAVVVGAGVVVKTKPGTYIISAEILAGLVPLLSIVKNDNDVLFKIYPDELPCVTVIEPLEPLVAMLNSFSEKLDDPVSNVHILNLIKAVDCKFIPVLV